MPVCNTCKKDKPAPEFYLNPRSSNGFGYSCRKCLQKRCREYQRNNKQKISAKGKKYYQKNKKTILARNKEWRIKNKEKTKQHSKEYGARNKEAISKNKAEYYQKNRVKLVKQKRRYRAQKALYNSWAPKIQFAEKVRQNPRSKKFLQVQCARCEKWFSPTNSMVSDRERFLNGHKKKGYSRFYCSDICKKKCPVFQKEKYPSGTAPYSSRGSGQKQWAELVIQRDKRCVKCGSQEKLIAHHFEGILWNPIESLDIDNGMTLCKKCHDKIHKQNGCRPADLRCKGVT